MALSSPDVYQVGGSLPTDAVTYVRRQADEDFYQGLRSGEFCYVLNSRQMGKSSLRVQVMRRLQAEGVACASVDVTAIGTAGIGPEQWYAGVIDSLVSSLGLWDRFDLDEWWAGMPLLSPVQRFGKFLEVLLGLVAGPVVILVDEIDSVLSLDFKVDDFFAVIRDCYNRRADQPVWRRLTFALIGVTTPADLIQNRQRTPFNIGRSIELAGFRWSEATALAEGLAGLAGDPLAVLAAVLDWTGGQPFLTQKVCRLVARSGQFVEDMSEREIADWVGGIVRDRILTNWVGQDDPEHLKTIRDRLLHSEVLSGRLLGLYRVVVETGELAVVEGADQMMLRLSGVVVKRDGVLRVYSRIYREVFDLPWVEGALGRLRPAYYGVAISEWLGSGDESRLLRGEALRDGMVWAEGRQLSDDDSRFLRLSQEAESRAEKEANQILAVAREQAERELAETRVAADLVRRKADRRNWVSAIGAVAAISVAGFAGFGAWTALDKRDTILKVGNLEKEGIAALNRSKYEQVSGLVDAMQSGQSVQSLVQKRGSEGFAASPIYALQSILDVVENRALQPWKYQRLLAHESDVTAAQFSPDGQYIVTASAGGARVWSAKFAREVFRLQGQYISAAQFSPDGQRIVTASWDGMAQVWDAKSGQELTKLQGHGDSIKSAQFSSDSQRIVTASDDKTARLWDARSGQELVKLQGHESSVESAKFSPDGQRIVTLSMGKIARIWDIKSGQELVKLQGHTDRVFAAVFSPDSQRIVTASQDKTVRLWDAKSGQELVNLKGHQSAVVSAVFSPNGQRLVTSSWDKTARVWDAKSGKELAKLQGHESSVESAQFSPNGQQIVTTSLGVDKTARVWDAKSGKELAKLQGHDSRVITAAFSPNGQRIVTIGDTTARMWDAKLDQPGQQIVKLQGAKKNLSGATFSPDRQRIVGTTWGLVSGIWDIKSGHRTDILQRHDFMDTTAIFNPNSERVIFIRDKTADVWDVKSDQRIAILQGHEDRVVDASFSPDGRRIITVSWDKTARVWDAKSGQQIAKFHHEDTVFDAQFSPNGQLVVSASADKTAQVWNAESGQQILKLQGREDIVAAKFSPDEQHIVTASGDKTARVWDAKSGQQIAILQGHEDSVVDASFSPDGQRIVTVSWDKTARVWDAKSGQQIDVLQEYESSIIAAVFSLDGQHILTVSANNTVRLWSVENLDRLLARGCTWLQNYLIVNPQDLIKLSTCQTAPITQASLPHLIKQSEAQARDGKIPEAIQGFTTAKQWDPSLTFDPVAKANELAKAAKSK